MVLYDVDGHVAVGPQTFGRSGCSQLVAETRGTVIDVRGVRYSGGGGVCPGVINRLWAEVPLHEGTTEITVRYRGHSGTYVFAQTAEGFDARHARGYDTAPLMAERWWRVPEDILAVQVWYGTRTAVNAVSDRVHDRLLEEGSELFARPLGVPIVPAWFGVHHSSQLDWWWSESLMAGDEPRRRRIYLTSLDHEALQRIATEESARDECAKVAMYRRDEWLHDSAVRASPPCARGNSS